MLVFFVLLWYNFDIQNKITTKYTCGGKGMLERLSDRIANSLVLQGIISKEDVDVYSYGLALLISFLFNSIVMLIVGILSHRLIETLLFLAVFVLLRSFTGGYHADTFQKCTVITFSTYGSVILLSTLNVITPVYLFAVIVGLFIIVWVAPVEHPNKEISARKKVHHKVTSLVLYIVFSASGFLLGNFNTRYKSVVFFALLADVVLLFIKNSKKGEVQNG